MTHGETSGNWAGLVEGLATRARELGFDQVGVADLDLATASTGLARWLAHGMHGEMDYMARHAALRADPQGLLPGALRAVMVRMPYLATALPAAPAPLGEAAAVSHYAWGRDYHKVLRSRLQQLGEQLVCAAGSGSFRVFTDSAPVFEVELARKAGLGWRGKHTLLLDRDGGSFFFLGGLLTDLPLPVARPTASHCGTCTKCIDLCPTRAIVAPYTVDARRCISYLTIELKEAIPEALRPLIGNRVYGCDDCQLVCPWNRFAPLSGEADFAVRNGLDHATLVDLFAWSEEEFKARMAGSAIYRIGHERWLRNLAVGLGNVSASPAVIAALESRRDDPSALVREHVGWALHRQRNRGSG